MTAEESARIVAYIFYYKGVIEIIFGIQIWRFVTR